MSKPEDPKPDAAPEAPKPEAPRRSAMKLPEGVTPRAPQGPRSRQGWTHSDGSRPQRDAARRAGKSRKVH